MEVLHQPKGGMCMSCKRRNDDCSGLRFHEMPVIEKAGNDVAIVKCTEFMRSGQGDLQYATHDDIGSPAYVADRDGALAMVRMGEPSD